MMRIYNEELDWDLFDKILESEMCNMEIWRLKLKCLMYYIYMNWDSRYIKLRFIDPLCI